MGENILKEKLLKQKEELEKQIEEADKEVIPAPPDDEKLKTLVENSIRAIKNQRMLMIGQIVCIGLVVLWVVLLYQL